MASDGAHPIAGTLTTAGTDVPMLALALAANGPATDMALYRNAYVPVAPALVDAIVQAVTGAAKE